MPGEDKKRRIQRSLVRRILTRESTASYRVEEALARCFAFNVTNRLAGALGFAVPEQPARRRGKDAFKVGAKSLLKREYR